MSQLIIQYQGNVQDIFIEGKGKLTRAIIVDEDIGEASKDEITSVKRNYSKHPYEACIYAKDINKLPKRSDVDRIVKQWIKDEKSKD